MSETNQSSGTDVAVLGVDIGGSSVEAVVVDDGERMVGRARIPTDTDGGDAVVDSAVQAIQAAIDSCPTAPSIGGIGVGVPGHVDGDSGLVRLAVNLNIDEPGLPIGPLLAERFGAPVVVENDARAGALGAFHHLTGEYPGVRTLAYLSIGTGLSAGVVIDGRLHRGRDGAAGEIGHVVVEEGGPACRCGLSGCLEAVAAGPAISRGWRGRNGRPAESLFRAAADGEPDAVRLADEVTGHLTQAASWLAAAYGADLVVLGGGVGSHAPVLEAIRERLAVRAGRSEVARRTLPPERVVAMPAGFPTGAMGAASLVRSKAGRGPGGGTSDEGGTG
jgi:glucokinase